MKVLRSGIHTHAVTRQCSGCTALLEIIRTDCRLMFDSSGREHYECACPECCTQLLLDPTLFDQEGATG